MTICLTQISTNNHNNQCFNGLIILNMPHKHHGHSYRIHSKDTQHCPFGHLKCLEQISLPFFRHSMLMASKLILFLAFQVYGIFFSSYDFLAAILNYYDYTLIPILPNIMEAWVILDNACKIHLSWSDRC